MSFMLFGEFFLALLAHCSCLCIYRNFKDIKNARNDKIRHTEYLMFKYLIHKFYFLSLVLYTIITKAYEKEYNTKRKASYYTRYFANNYSNPPKYTSIKFLWKITNSRYFDRTNNPCVIYYYFITFLNYPIIGPVHASTTRFQSFQVAQFPAIGKHRIYRILCEAEHDFASDFISDPGPIKLLMAFVIFFAM